MTTIRSLRRGAVFVALAGALASVPALAQKPDWAGKGKNGKGEQGEPRKEQRHEARGGGFSDAQRAAMHGYYADQMRSGKCPPGLAKKRNGCMPPGQAKKWALGQPLAIGWSPLPPYMRDRLGPPPAGHQYVRVANDILMIAVGTSLVVDAIEDLGSMR